MKKLSLILVAFSLIGLGQVFGQATITVGANPLTLPCGGGNVNLTALGNSSVPVFGDNFNNGTVAPGWSATAAAQFNNPCGASVDGTTYLWMGSGTSAPREMTTAPVDVSCGGTVCFDFKFVCEQCGDSAPCEGADLYNEGVSLQCSTNGGATWTDFAYFAPNGDVLTAYPGGVTQPSASGNTPFTTWQNYCFTIPAGCETANTMFQLHQWGSSGSNYDHWGIDNFYVYADPCAPYYYDWDHIPGAPDAPDVTTNITQTTTFTCCYTNGTDAACESVTVVVDVLPDAVVSLIYAPSCFGASDGGVTIDNPGGQGPYNVVVTGPVTASYTEGNGPPDALDIDDLPAGTYTYTTTQQNGSCTNTGTFTIPDGPPCCEITATATDVICNGGSTGVGNSTVVDGIAPYSFQWNDGGNQTTQSASGLSAGNYSVILTDGIGCQDTAFITVGEPTAVSGSITNSTNPLCLNSCDGTITASGSGGAGGYTYSLNGQAFQASGNYTGLCAGNYTIVVQDAAGCQFTLAPVTLTNPTDVTLVEVSTTPATCGGSDGIAEVLAGGGTPPYDYDIGGASQTSPIFTGLSAGSYTVTVTDDNGCTETVNVTIVDAAGPTLVVDSQTNVNCAGAPTGSVTLGVVGGTGPFTYSIDGVNFQASNTFTGLLPTPVVHTFTVEDNFGCTATVDVTLSQNPPLQIISEVVTDPLCTDDCNGQLTIGVSGGQGPYTYSKNGVIFQASNTLTGLCPGLQGYVVQDVNGCLINGDENIPNPPPLTLTPTYTEPSCHGLADGSITFAGAGGNPAYQYSVDDGATFGFIDPVNGIAAGFYELTIMDANGCQTDDTLTVTEPAPFTFVYVYNDPSNCGSNDGAFEITAVNGFPNYTYHIGNGVPDQVNNGNFTGLFSGLYQLIVTDQNGCQDSTFQALSDNVMTTQTDFIQPATCFNSCDGGAIVSQINGQSPYTYEINTSTAPPQAFGVFTNLCAGQHFITIHDNGSCIGIEEINIPQPDSILFDLAADSVSCPDGADGQITISNVTGGDTVNGYTYSIDGVNFQASPIFPGLTSGNYVLWVQDANGCLGSDDIDIFEPAPWDIGILEVDVTCNGGNTGFAQVVADPNGATDPFSYDLNGTVNVSGQFPLLTAGVYPVTITDANNCTFDTIATINEPTPVDANLVATNPLCFGSADGTITVTASGGTPGTPAYMYSADGGTTWSSNNVLSGLTDGCYDVVVEDDNSCTYTENICITEPAEVTLSFTFVEETCGAGNGEINMTGAGGDGNFLYSINGGALSPSGSFLSLSAGNFILYVEDGNGCFADSAFTLTAFDQPLIDNVTFTDPSCATFTDGDIEVFASGGLAPYGYSITGAAPFQLPSTFAGIGAGVYTVAVQDANGCIVTSQITLTDPAVLTLNTNVTDLFCNGDNTGQLELVGGGGTLPYMYSINGGALQGGGTFSGLAAGNYTTHVEDAQGCVVDANEVINEPAPMVFDSFVITDPTCFNDCDGQVAIQVSGGQGAATYTYNWSGNIAGPNDATATGVCAGTYSVYITDGNNCTLDSVDFVVNNPAQFVANGLTTTDVLCYGGNTGTITVTLPVTGTPTYQYSINGGAPQASNVFGDVNGGTITAGNYDITIIDADGCEALTNTTIYQPSELYALAPSDWTSCYNEIAVVQGFVNGGEQPYTYEWTNDVNATIENTLLFNHVVTQPITFTLVVTDDNGCVAPAVSYTITPTPPLQLDLLTTNDTTICEGDSTTLGISVSGGQMIDFGNYMGYSYSWDTGIPGDTLSDVTVGPMTTTTYTVTVTDLCGEVADTSITVTVYPNPVVPYLGDFYGCEPATFDFDISADIPAGYTFNWNLGNGSSATNPVVSNASYPNAGYYEMSLEITSDQGCVSTSASAGGVYVNEPPVPGFYFDPYSPSVLEPTVQINDYSEGGTSWYYTFEDYGSSSQQEPEVTFNVEEETTIYVCQYVTSDDGCEASVCAPLVIHEEIIFYVPNVVTPDGDLFNEVFYPVFTSGVDPYDYHLTIFNRWGEVVFESYDFTKGWNCHYGDGGLVQDGVYVWQIEFGEKLTDKKQTHRGHVTVLK
ncbi:gliding motility-associated C-terminal domain-containing protein [Paracrocinitomix mangrovi]|uniref:T9SS type B sorting domain-containing protein n=1 Tax=Paracrocinitomix mangrovi TaxID=2862509 RepID=UPI001C8ED863|nr:gliding motility-associated C-terminal domain-containing protein [Paracrocinitomix mangrovi]UKN01759.1 gliding motility-associated C-terminal domain-containing protein [Paracrocinitomix mangrovi]